MFITVHAATGALIGQHINNPLAAFAVGFASHFLVDAIPHGDEHLVFAPRNSAEVKYQLKHIKLDSAAGIAFTGLSFGFKVYANPLSAAFGIFGAVLPDVLIGLYELSELKKWQRKLFCRFKRFHHWCHNNIITWQPKRKIGYSIQAIAFTAILIALF